MANVSVRHLVTRSGAAGGLPRYFWQPSSKLRAEGWRPERVPLDWSRHQDPSALFAAAVARAEQLNAGLDDSRATAGLASVEPPVPLGSRTLGDLIKAYQASREFAGKSENTRRSYRQCLDKLASWAGDAPVGAVDPVRVQKLLDSLASTPAYGNAVVRVLALLLEHGRRNGWVLINHAARAKLVGTAPTGLIWPRQAVDDFVAAADELGHHSVGTAVLLNSWLGQREADIITMSRAAIRQGGLLVRQGKKKARVMLPIHLVEHLSARLEAELARHAKREAKLGAVAATTVIVSELTGAAYKGDNFRHVFAKVRARAASRQAAYEIEHLMPGREVSDADAFQVRMADLTFMALRHTAITRLAEAGCDAGQISTISGHAQGSVLQIMERYLVRTAEIARVAFTKRRDAEAPVKEVITSMNG